jgi:hypothetical protein
MAESILSADSQAGIDRWSQWASEHEDKKVKGEYSLKSHYHFLTSPDWYSNKQAHAGWLLPSLNPFLSKIRPDLWKLVRKDTNIVETQHAWTNGRTGIGLTLVEAIERCVTADCIVFKLMHNSARATDQAVLNDLKMKDILGVRGGHQKSDHHRAQRGQQRKTTKSNQKKYKRDLEAQLQEKEGEIEDLQSKIEKARADSRLLKAAAKVKPLPTWGRTGCKPLREGQYRYAPEDTEAPPMLPPSNIPSPSNDPFQPSMTALPEQFPEPTNHFTHDSVPSSSENLGMFVPPLGSHPSPLYPAWSQGSLITGPSGAPEWHYTQ